MPKISLPQKQITLDVEVGSNLMDALIQAHIPVASSCQGDGICSMCRMQIEGHTAPPSAHETETLKRNKCEPGERLSCQIQIENDLTVTTRYW